MSKRKNDNPQTRDTRRRIKRGLLSLMGSTPYGQITVTGVAEEACVARASFYQHFKSKDDVVEAIVRDVFSYHLRRIERTGSFDVEKGWELLFETFGRYRDVFLLLGRNNLLHIWAKVMRDYQAPGANLPFPHKEAMSADAYAYYVEYHSIGLATMAYRWLERGCPHSPDQMAAMLVDIRNAERTVRVPEE